MPDRGAGSTAACSRTTTCSTGASAGCSRRSRRCTPRGHRTAGAGRNRRRGARAAPAISSWRRGPRARVGAGCSRAGSRSNGPRRRRARRRGALLGPRPSATPTDRAQRGRRPASGDLVVASIHWGGNWGYAIPARHRRFAHALIDAAGVDVVHGHSSHHPKAIEVLPRQARSSTAAATSSTTTKASAATSRIAAISASLHRRHRVRTHSSGVSTPSPSRSSSHRSASVCGQSPRGSCTERSAFLPRARRPPSSGWSPRSASSAGGAGTGGGANLRAFAGFARRWRDPLALRRAPASRWLGHRPPRSVTRRAAPASARAAARSARPEYAGRATAHTLSVVTIRPTVQRQIRSKAPGAITAWTNDALDLLAPA